MTLRAIMPRALHKRRHWCHLCQRISEISLLSRQMGAGAFLMLVRDFLASGIHFDFTLTPRRRAAGLRLPRAGAEAYDTARPDELRLIFPPSRATAWLCHWYRLMTISRRLASNFCPACLVRQARAGRRRWLHKYRPLRRFAKNSEILRAYFYHFRHKDEMVIAASVAERLRGLYASWSSRLWDLLARATAATQEIAKLI